MANGVMIGGVEVKRVTGHNAKFIHDNDIGPGTIINIIRSGDVIPKVESVVKSTKAQMPSTAWEWDENKTHAIAKKTGSEHARKVKVKKIAFFMKTMGVGGVDEKTVDKLVANGFPELHNIVWADPKELTKIPGVQSTSANNLTRSLHSSLRSKKVDPARYMMASGVFGRGLGLKRLQAIINMYPNILKKMKRSNESDMLAMVMAVPGFSFKMAKEFAKGIKDFVKFSDDMGLKIKKPKKVEGKLTGETVVFTGFRDSAMEERIQALGGTIGSSVTRATTVLVYKAGSTGAKVKKAQSMGIKMYTKEEWEDFLA